MPWKNEIRIFPAGRIRGGERETLTRLVGRFQSAEDLRNLPIEVPGTNPPQQVALQDVATIVDGIEEQRGFVNLNRQPRRESQRPETTGRQHRWMWWMGSKPGWPRIDQAGLMPEGMDMTATLDESRFIRNSIRNVAVAGLTGATLAAAAVLAVSWVPCGRRSLLCWRFPWRS